MGKFDTGVRERDGFGPWGEKKGPRPWTPEEAADFDYPPSCSICGTEPGKGKLEFGDIITDLEDPAMIKGMVEDQPEMAETVIEASNREGTILFICHKTCADTRARRGGSGSSRRTDG